MTHEPILREVEAYYSGRLDEHGATPNGVDWNSEKSQRLRFDQLLTVLPPPDGLSFSLNDYGCGYGALAEVLAARYDRFAYTGFDLSTGMLAEGRERLAGDDRCSLVSDDGDLLVADYTLASGIFNVRLGTSEGEWRAYVLDTIDRLAELSASGFAFNMLTSYSDTELMRDNLYYGDPLFFFDHCKRTYSRQVALLHDYGLWEWTLIVRLEEEKRA